MFASQQTQLMRESLSDEQLQIVQEKHINELINESAENVSNIISVNKSIISSTNISRKRNKDFNFIVENDKDFIFIIVDRNICFKINKLSSINYKKFQNLEKQLKETTNYLNDLYNVKYILNSHNHMQKTLNVLMIEENFELKHVLKLFIYKQAFNSSF